MPADHNGLSNINMQIEQVQAALYKAKQVTKSIKNSDTVQNIIVAVQQLAQTANIDKKELKYAIDDIFEAERQLESSVFGLIDIFNDRLRILSNHKEELENSDDLLEGKYSYDKKSGSIKQDNNDPDQRHGLYKDGKLVKTYSTKEQADNVKARDPKFKDATVKKIAEGMMGGINRCAPAQDVSYENILNDVYDTWRGQKTTVNELDTKNIASELAKYRSGVSPEEYYSNPEVQDKVDRAAELGLKISNRHVAKANASGQLNELSPGKYDSVKSALQDPNIAKTRDKYKLARDPESYARADKLQKIRNAKDKSVFQPAGSGVVAESYEDKLKKFL